MSYQKDFQIDTKKLVCYTEDTSETYTDMNLDNGIQQTDNNILTSPVSISTRKSQHDVYIDHDEQRMSEQSISSSGGSSMYHVSREGKFISVFDDSVTVEELQPFIDKGYKVAYFVRGSIPTVDIMRTLIQNRCKQR